MLKSAPAHRDIGAYLVKKGFEILITVGELAKFIAAGAWLKANR